MGPRCQRGGTDPNALSLAQAPAGQPFVVAGFSGGRRFRQQAMNMGIVRGGEVTVVRRHGGGGSLLLAVGEGRIMLGQGMAGKVLVRAIDPIDSPAGGRE